MTAEPNRPANSQPAQSPDQIGIALSGGGIRATVFHLGVLARLAQDDLLESISFISSVSDGSLAAGLVYSANDNVWPDKCFELDRRRMSIVLKLIDEGGLMP